MIETWHEMKLRHIREKREAVTRLRDKGLTRPEAGRVLGMSRGHVHEFCRQQGIEWEAKGQDHD